MISILLFGLIAGAYAAPQFFQRHHGPPPPPFPDNRFTSPYINNDVFDTQSFWSNLNRELKELDDMLAEFSRRFPTSIDSQQGVEGNEYKITIALPEFEEKDVVVKVREGLLMVQATHTYESGSQRTYLDARTIPDTVNITGVWTFDKGVLKIVFPLKSTPEVPITTAKPNFESREEVESETEENTRDADVGLNRGDQGKERELQTNEIPNSRNAVEATTYPVDLKDEVEFVPVRS